MRIQQQNILHIIKSLWMKYQHEGTHPDIYLFINSASGGGRGKELLDRQSKQFNLSVSASQYPKDKHHLVSITLHLFNLQEAQDRNKGFLLVKAAVQQQRPIILVICGGDGTVMWVVKELSKYQIEHSKVPMALIPLGTGNDFSQVLGWGKECPSDLLDNDFAKLKKRVSYWLSAKDDNLDIWMAEATVQQYGKFEKVQKSQPKEIEGKTFTKHFCNYFSVGVDGKVGFSFDLHRTTSRIGNLVVYSAMGLVKSFTKTKTVGELTHTFKESCQSENQCLQIQLNGQAKNIIPQQQPKNTILEAGNSHLEAIKDNQNLVFLNINSFMGGTKDVWINAKDSPHIKDIGFTSGSDSDGKIQVISFGGVWSLGLQKPIGGFGSKVHQGRGPFELQFIKFPQQEKHRTYMQIDGEYFRYTHPKGLIIKKSSLSKTGQIRVLRRIPLKVQRNCCC